jgi:uncharacterized protein YutE (UPF0331/DUF86 family)/predicted nucleotidyltransferase
MIKQKRLPRDVGEKLQAIAQSLLAFPGLNALWIFGSYARGEATPLSDVDIAYLAMPGVRDPQSWDARLYHDLSSLLETDEITLVNLAEAPPTLACRVLREGRLLSCRDPRGVADLTEGVLGKFPEARRIIEDELQGETGATMEIDREKVLAQLRLLEADLRRLREKAGLTEENYLADLDAQDVVMRRFQTAVESCVNIGNHFIARLRLRLAEDYATVFAILGDEGILTRELADRLGELARFRNLLVHMYWRVDHQQVFRAMPERIRMLEEFQAQIRRFLETS